MNTNVGLTGLSTTPVTISTAAGTPKSNTGEACVAFKSATFAGSGSDGT